MLAPRLAMLCRGTAWGQVKGLDPASLTDPTNGVKNLLAALAVWEESSEMKTYELFERALYKTTQRSDESTMSYVNRLQVAMNELGAKDVAQFQAFLLLRQSALGIEDKKRVLSMTNGDMETAKIQAAMRTLATSALTPANEPKKKVYPVNYVEPENTEPETTFLATMANGNPSYDDEEIEPEFVDLLVTQGDSDALQVTSFERDLEELFQEIPDLHQALVSYHEARGKLLDKKKHRGFWPASSQPGKGKGKGSFGRFRKGQGKGNLLLRISRTNCKLCGERGHWKAECPNKPSGNPDSANVATHQAMTMETFGAKSDQILFEDDDESEAWSFSDVHRLPLQTSEASNHSIGHHQIGISWIQVT